MSSPKGALPLGERSGFQHVSKSALTRDIGLLAKKHGLLGCVLVTFTAERFGVGCSAEEPFLPFMQRLGDLILTALDDGAFDGALREACRAKAGGGLD